MSPKSLKHWFLLGAMGLILIGCGGGGDSEEQENANPATATVMSGPPSSISQEPSNLEPGESMTLEQMRERVYADVDIYSWPPHYYPDLDRHFEVYGPNWENTGFQPGYHQTFLGIANACAWSESWLSTRSEGNAEGEETAMQELITISEESVLSESPSTRDYLQGMVELAQLGDPTQIQTWVDANCKPGYWMDEPVSHSATDGRVPLV